MTTIKLCWRQFALLALTPLALAIGLAVSAAWQTQDDTARVQAYFDSPDANGVVKIPAGTYVITSVKADPNRVKYVLGSHTVPLVAMPGKPYVVTYNTHLVQKPYAGPWNRMLMIDYKGATVRNLTITGLHFDMNRDNQGPYQNFELEHQGTIFATATYKDSLNIKLINTKHENSAGDGPYIYHNANMVISGYTANKIFRASPGITGKNAKVSITNFVMNDAGIDVEPNSSTDVVDVTMSNGSCTKFDVALTANSRFYATSVKVNGVPATSTTPFKPAFLHAYCPDSTNYNCQGCEFRGGRFELRLPNCKFQNCIFETIPGNNSNVIYASWYRYGYIPNLTLTMENCQIIGGGASYVGLDLAAFKTEANQQLVINGLAVTKCLKAVDKGINNGSWGIVSAKGVTLNGNPVNVP